MKPVVLVLFTFFATAAKSEIVDVTNFGAIPDDGLDDTLAIRAAIDALPSSGGTLRFAPGVFDLRGREPISQFLFLPAITMEVLSNLLVEGNGATLRMNAFGGALYFYECTNVRVQNLDFDYADNSLPYTVGRVVAAGVDPTEGRYLDFEVQGVGRPALGAQGFFEYDFEQQAIPVAGYDLLVPNDGYSRCRALSAAIQRCELPASAHVLAEGSTVLVRHQIYGGNSINVERTSGLELSNIRIFAAAGAGVALVAVRDTLIENIKIQRKPNSSRPISTNADGIHCNNCRGSFLLDGGTFESMGDDALNVHANLLRLDAFTNRSSARFSLARGGRLDSTSVPAVGDRIGISNPELHPVLQIETAIVSAVDSYDGQSVRLNFSSPLSDRIIVGALAADLDMVPQSLRVNNVSVRKNRSHGVLVQSPNVIIENSTFERTSLAGVFLKGDAKVFFEGVVPNNVNIRNNRFTNVNFGVGFNAPGSAIEIGALLDNGSEGVGLFRDITIDNNVFEDADGKAAVSVNGVDLFRFGGNELRGGIVEPLKYGRDNGCDFHVDNKRRCHDYKREFRSPLPADAWSYLAGTGVDWASGALVPLVWNGEAYDSDGMLFPALQEPSLSSIGGQAGAGSGLPTDVYSVASIEVPFGGLYEISESVIQQATECSPTGTLLLAFGVNDQIILEQQIPGEGVHDFDGSLGFVASGDNVKVGLTRSGPDNCGEFEWDFRVGEVSDALETGYREQFRPHHPATRWRFSWNADGEFTGSSNLRDLVWNGSQYDGDGNPGLPDAGSGFLFLGTHGGHAGPAGAIARWAVAEVIVARAGRHSLRGRVFRPDHQGDGVDLRVYVGDRLVLQETVPPGNEMPLDLDLGSLSAGELVRVGIGPRADSNFDTFEWELRLVTLHEQRAIGHIHGDGFEGL